MVEAARDLATHCCCNAVVLSARCRRVGAAARAAREAPSHILQPHALAAVAVCGGAAPHALWRQHDAHCAGIAQGLVHQRAGQCATSARHVVLGCAPLLAQPWHSPRTSPPRSGRRHDRDSAVSLPAAALQVLALNEVSRMNERCLDLQRQKAKSSKTTAVAAAGKGSAPACCSWLAAHWCCCCCMRGRRQVPAAGQEGGIGGGGGYACTGTWGDVVSMPPLCPDAGTATLARPTRAKATQKKQAGCPHLHAGPEAAEQFREAVLAVPIDVEELARVGRVKQVGCRWQRRCCRARCSQQLGTPTGRGCHRAHSPAMQRPYDARDTQQEMCQLPGVHVRRVENAACRAVLAAGQ
jgi:hypothetical protein